MGLKLEKMDLRVQVKNQLAELSTEEKEKQSLAIADRLANFLNNKQETWALYSPLPEEPNVLPLLQSCSHIDWVFPKMVSSTELEFYRVTNGDQMVTTSWGLEEPDPNQSIPVDMASINGFLIPGLAFDGKGTRLGRGGGYYDRALIHHPGVRVGVTFTQGYKIEGLPREAHDQTMDFVVSPLGWTDIQLNKNGVENGI